jgi:hypothetical protein
MLVVAARALTREETPAYGSLLERAGTALAEGPKQQGVRPERAL